MNSSMNFSKDFANHPSLNSVPLRRLIHKHGNLGYLLVGFYLLGYWLLRFKRSQTLGVLSCVTLLGLVATSFSLRTMAHHAGVTTDSYTIVDLGVVGDYKYSFGESLNARGQTAGVLSDEEFETLHGFWCTSGGKMFDIGTLGGELSVASGLNDDGQVVGSSLTSKEQVRGFIWKDNKMTPLGTLGGEFSSALGINNKGQVVGISDTSRGLAHAFVWQDGTMKDIGASCPGQFNGATAINDNGDITGIYTNDGETIQAFVFSGNKSKVLPTLGGDFTLATAISKMLVVGGGTIKKGDTDTVHSFAWQPGGIRDMGTLGGKISFASGVNDSGQAVGLSETSSGMIHAFVWQEGQMKDLNTMLPSGSGWELFSASGINAKGQIVGTGIVGDSIHAFLLTPKG